MTDDTTLSNLFDVAAELGRRLQAAESGRDQTAVDLQADSPDDLRAALEGVLDRIQLQLREGGTTA